MVTYNKDDVIQLTPKWKGERFADGRPRVSDEILRRIAKTTTTEMWAPLYMRGYKFQFEAGFKRTNPDMPVMIGRAVTASFLPIRPDLSQTLLALGHSEGRKGHFNQWAIEDLQENDVLVYDVFDKVREGCTLGGNLTNLIANKTNQGAVVWGGVRDLEQLMDIHHAQFYYRENDPTPFMESMIRGINVPCKIGAAVAMPGDVVLGTASGIIFIPPHLAELCVINAEKAHVRDIWGFKAVKDLKYTAQQMDTAWELAMWEDFTEWFNSDDPEAQEYQHLDFSQELEDIRNGVKFRRWTPEDDEAYFASQGQTSNKEQSSNDPETRW